MSSKRTFNGSIQKKQIKLPTLKHAIHWQIESNNMIAIIDYELGNLYSVKGALEHLGLKAKISSDPKVLKEASHLILPGVGAFPHGMEKLKEARLLNAIEEQVLNKKKPILGICLGLQLLCKSSEEFGNHKGLDWVDIDVKKFPQQKGSVF